MSHSVPNFDNCDQLLIIMRSADLVPAEFEGLMSVCLTDGEIIVLSVLSCTSHILWWRTGSRLSVIVDCIMRRGCRPSELLTVVPGLSRTETLDSNGAAIQT